MDTVNGLYNSTFSKTKACGYCAHHGYYLTVKQLKQHDCLQKQCHYLRKLEEHSWWKQREVTKQRRVDRKVRLLSGNYSL